MIGKNRISSELTGRDQLTFTPETPAEIDVVTAVMKIYANGLPKTAMGDRRSVQMTLDTLETLGALDRTKGTQLPGVEFTSRESRVLRLAIAPLQIQRLGE